MPNLHRDLDPRDAVGFFAAALLIIFLLAALGFWLGFNGWGLPGATN